jgi:hypothetical protein
MRYNNTSVTLKRMKLIKRCMTKGFVQSNSITKLKWIAMQDKSRYTIQKEVVVLGK